MRDIMRIYEQKAMLNTALQNVPTLVPGTKFTAVGNALWSSTQNGLNAWVVYMSNGIRSCNGKESKRLCQTSAEVLIRASHKKNASKIEVFLLEEKKVSSVFSMSYTYSRNPKRLYGGRNRIFEFCFLFSLKKRIKRCQLSGVAKCSYISSKEK